MSGVDFLGSNALDTAETLERLAHDLRQLAGGSMPDQATLAEAPFLHRWQFVQRPILALGGSVHGHPKLGDDRSAITSEIYALDPQRRWARSLNRYYALGPAALKGIGARIEPHDRS